MGVWNCVCEGQPNLSERAFSLCSGQTPGQPQITLNSNCMIRDRLLQQSEKQCHRNGDFQKVLVEALEQKNPDGTAIPQDIPIPGLGSAGPCGAAAPHKDMWVTCPCRDLQPHREDRGCLCC